MNTLIDKSLFALKYGKENREPSANVKMDYMYRDAGNNKLRSFAIFTNTYHLTICQIADFISAAFIDKCWFDPDLCGMEKLVFERHDDELDHEWHEIEWIGETEEAVTMDIDIADFVFNAMKAHVNWVQFDCRDNEFTFEP